MNPMQVDLAGRAATLAERPPAKNSIQCSGCGVRMYYSERTRRKLTIQCPRCQTSVALPAAHSVPFPATSTPCHAPAQPDLAEPIASEPNPRPSFHKTVGMLWTPLGIACGLLVTMMAVVLIFTLPSIATSSAAPPDPQDAASLENVRSIAGFFERENKKLSAQVDSLNAEIRRLLEEVKRLEQDRLKVQEENKQLQEKVVFVNRWRGASLLVMDHNSFATALQTQSDGTFRVIATAEHPWVTYASQVAYKFQIPKLVRDPRLARKIHAAADNGGPLPLQLADDLQKYWRVHKYVPPGPNDLASLVVFRDVAQNRHRLGFFVSADPDGLHFHPVGSTVEHIPRSRIEPSSALKGPGPTLRLEAETDFLDLCALSIAQKLGTTDSPRLINLAVDVSVDTLEEFLQQSKEPDQKWNDIIFDFLARWRREPYRADSRKAHARWLRDAARELHDELVGRLSRLGIPLLERDEIERVLAERGLTKHSEFEPREYSRLLCASHLLVAEVDKPSQDGKLRLSIRLDDVDNGQTIWADNCDIERRKSPEVATFLLDSGKPALVTFANSKMAPVRSGTPLVLPRLAGEIDEEPLRLCYVERSARDDQMFLRDLFRHQLHPLPRAAVKKIDEDVSIDRVPPNQRLRYAMWQIARSVLPTAGRITSVNHDRAAITLGRRARIDVGSRYNLWRVATEFDDHTADLDQWRRLPIEVMTTEVADTQAKVFVATSGVESVWPDASEICVGDLVVRKDAPAPLVAVVPPVFDLSLLDPQVANKYQLLGQPARLRIQGNVERSSERLREHTETSLKKLNVACADPGQVARFAALGLNAPLDLARTLGVTHVIYGSICPASIHTESQNLSLSLRILDVARSETALTLPHFNLSMDQLDHWVP